MFFKKLLIATIGFAVPLTASTAVMAHEGGWEDHRDWDDDNWHHDHWDDDDDWNDDDDDDWNDDDDDWNDDDDDWDDDDWNNDDWNDDDWDHDSGHNHGNSDAGLLNLEFIDKGERLVVFGELEHPKHKGDKVIIHLEARGDASAVCIHPNGKIPPGKNPVDAGEINVSGGVKLDLDDFDKGELDFKVATARPGMTLDGAPDCPNWKWTEKLVDIAFTEVKLTVVQDGKEVLELECFFDDPTDDGEVSPKELDCEEL